MNSLRKYIQEELQQEFLLEFDADQLIQFHLTKMDNIDKDGIYYEGKTKDGKKIEVRFGADSSAPFANGDYDVTFYVDNSPYEVVNAGAPFSTIASVMKVIDDFCEKVRPKALVWVSTKTDKDAQYKPGQRDLLYKRFLSRQVPSGYKFIEGGWGGGVLERIDQSEPAYVWPGATPYLAPPKEKLKDPFADFKFDYNDPEMIKEVEEKYTEYKDVPDMFAYYDTRDNYWRIYERRKTGGAIAIALLRDISVRGGELEWRKRGSLDREQYPNFGNNLHNAMRLVWLNRQKLTEESATQ